MISVESIGNKYPNNLFSTEKTCNRQPSSAVSFKAFNYNWREDLKVLERKNIIKHIVSFVVTIGGFVALHKLDQARINAVVSIFGKDWRATDLGCIALFAGFLVYWLSINKRYHEAAKNIKETK